jgi:hypothetical protein
VTGARIPLAGTSELRPAWRRTRAIRGVLALALVVLVVVAAIVSNRPPAHAVRFLPRASNGIIVLDLSASISSDTFNRIGETLDELASTNGRYGLVVFSDVAYQALPPGTPSAALVPYARYFKAPPQKTPGLLPAFPVNPWTDSFSAGTRISAGLGLAFSIIKSDRLAHPGVILISDLDDDPSDAGKPLAAAMFAFRTEHVAVRVVALNPSPSDQAMFENLLGAASHLTQAHLPGDRTTTRSAGFPYPLAALAVVIALALAANELFGRSLSWEARA